MTVDSLLRDFPLELGGIATITENGRVISSNSSKQVNKAIEDCQELYNGTFGAAEDGIVRLNSHQASGTAAGKIPRTIRSLCFSRHLRCS